VPAEPSPEPKAEPEPIVGMAIFKDLSPSDEFLMDGCLFVKTETIGYHYVEALTYNAVNLVTGFHTRISGNVIVDILL